MLACAASRYFEENVVIALVLLDISAGTVSGIKTPSETAIRSATSRSIWDIGMSRAWRPKSTPAVRRKLPSTRLYSGNRGNHGHAGKPRSGCDPDASEHREEPHRLPIAGNNLSFLNDRGDLSGGGLLDFLPLVMPLIDTRCLAMSFYITFLSRYSSTCGTVQKLGPNWFFWA